MKCKWILTPKPMLFHQSKGSPPSQVLTSGCSPTHSVRHHLPSSVTFPQKSDFLLKQFNILQTKNLTKSQKFIKFRDISVHVFKILRVKGSTPIANSKFLKRKITSSFIYWNCLEAEVRKSSSLICDIYVIVIPKEQNLFCFIFWNFQYCFIRH